jgi:hypothetical protein
VVRFFGKALMERIGQRKIEGVTVQSTALPRPSPIGSSTATRSGWTWRSRRCVKPGAASAARPGICGYTQKSAMSRTSCGLTWRA